MSTSIDIFVQAIAPPHTGGWISDVETRTPDELAELIAEATEHAEEWRISDAEGFGFDLPEHLAPAALLELAEWCDRDENDDEGVRAACAVVARDDHGEITTDALRAARSRFLAAHEEPGDYAHAAHGDGAAQLGVLARYVAYERLEHDLVVGGDVVLIVIEERRFFFTP